MTENWIAEDDEGRSCFRHGSYDAQCFANFGAPVYQIAHENGLAISEMKVDSRIVRKVSQFG